MSEKLDPPRSRNVKLTDAEWAALERIARENGLEWGGVPSRSGAVRLLIRREIERLEPISAGSGPRRIAPLLPSP